MSAIRYVLLRKILDRVSQLDYWPSTRLLEALVEQRTPSTHLIFDVRSSAREASASVSQLAFHDLDLDVTWDGKGWPDLEATQRSQMGSQPVGSEFLVVPPETDLFDASYVVAFTRSALAEQSTPVGLLISDTQATVENVSFVDLDLDFWELGGDLLWSEPLDSRQAGSPKSPGYPPFSPPTLIRLVFSGGLSNDSAPASTSAARIHVLIPYRTAHHFSMPCELDRSILLEDFSPRRRESSRSRYSPEMLMMFLFLSFLVPVAGVSLLQVERRPGVVRFGAPEQRPMLLEEGAGSAEDGKESVELLRFVTPYKTPLEAVVDITAYSQLMKSLISSGPVEFYVAIDTWDSNDTRSKVLYVSNVSDSCSSIWTSQGNAWNVSLDFVQWPRLPAEPVKPKRTILLAESFPNPLLAIGQDGQWEIAKDFVDYTGSEIMSTAHGRHSHQRRANQQQWWFANDSVWEADAWTSWAWNQWHGFGGPPWQGGQSQGRMYSESSWRPNHRVEAPESEYIEVEPGAMGLVLGRCKEHIKRWKKDYNVNIEVCTNDTDGQFEGRIHKQTGLVVTGSQGAIERIRCHVQKIESKRNAGRFRDQPEERKLYVITEPAFRSLTFCKADMNKSLANFGSFPNRTYFELRGLNHGREEPSNTPGLPNITLSRDCAPLVHDFQALLPVWMEQMDDTEDTKVVIRLGRLLYFGKRDTVKGVLSTEKIKELMSGQDFLTQFSRHLHPQKNVVQPVLEGLKDAGKCTVKDLRKEKRHRTELRFHLEMPEGATPQDLPKEIDVKTVKTFSEFISKLPQDLKHQFQGAKWRILPGDGSEEGIGLQLSDGQVCYTLRRKTRTREVWFDGHVEMIWTEAVDLFNGCQLPYEGLHLSSPALNAALKARETAKAVCEFQLLLETAQHLVLRFSRQGQEMFEVVRASTRFNDGLNDEILAAKSCQTGQ
eukprot:s81_g26.t1